MRKPVNLRTRLWSIGALLRVAATATLVADGAWQARAAAQLALEQAGVVLARDLVRAPPGDLQARVDELTRQGPVVYAVALDPRGLPLARTAHAPGPEAFAFENQHPEDKLDHGSARLDPAPGSAEPAVLDVALWSTGPIAAVHVGLSLASAEAALSATLRRQLALALVLASTALAIWFLMLRRTLGPLQELTRAAGRLATGEDQALASTPRATGELATLVGHLQRVAARLQEAPGALQLISKRLTDDAHRVATATHKHSMLLDRQSAALQEAQVTAQQIRQVSLAAATSVTSIIAAAEKADQLGSAGETALEGSVDELTAIRAQVDAISRQIGALNERTTQIGAVTATVKELADQSSILALNAAIEAVRSGQHGQGFSTVAHEIRSLADQSIDATQRVRDLLEDINRATREAVRFTEQGAERIDKSLKEIRGTGDSLRELSTLVRQNAAAVRQIANAVGQQNAGISQLFEAINDLGRMVEDETTELEATDEASLAIEGIADEMARTVARMRS